MYLYKTTLWYDDTDVYTPPASNATDVTNFEGATKKPNALEVSGLVIAETTFEVAVSYSTFDGYVDGTTITWNDVKYTDDGHGRYTLYLASASEL